MLIYSDLYNKIYETETSMYSILVCDTSPDVCECLVKQLGNFSNSVGTVCGPLATLLTRLQPCEKVAIVSPGNSFGFLGGGFDLAICEQLGGAPFEAWFRAQLPGLYQPVGSCNVVDLTKGPYAHRNVRYIVHVPTVVTPMMDVCEGSRLAFDGMWNVLERCPRDVDVVVVPGLATGYGGVPVEVSCKSMAFALIVHQLDVSEELRILLVMYYLGCGYDGFFSKNCRKECEEVGIDLKALKNFDARYDSIKSILPK